MASEDYKDIYIRGIKDPYYNELEIETITKLDGIISKLYMILFTNKGEVLSDINFGADIPTYLWKTSFPASSIQAEIEEQISLYIPELSPNQYNVRVYIMKGTIQDIGVIEINLGNSNVSVLFK